MNGLHARRDIGRTAQARARPHGLSTSPAGYRKALDIMAAQGVLQRDTERRRSFDPNLYFIPVFRDSLAPGRRAGVRASLGHFTVVDGRLVNEPFFLGAWPTRAGRRWRPSHGRAGLSDDAARGGRSP